MKKSSIIIRLITPSDFTQLITDFTRYGWPCPQDRMDVYQFQIQEQQRVMWIAYDTATHTYVGYITLVWNSEYKPFFENQIPEIKDLNVVPVYRHQGIGSLLLENAEQEAKKRSSIIGIGVGLTADYGPAQRLYIKRGYVPDGNGLTDHYTPLTQGRMAMVDGLTLWLIKTHF